MEITQIIAGLIGWLRDEPTEPELKLVADNTVGVTAAYPSAAVVLERERFEPAGTDAVVELSIELSCAAGKVSQARESVALLAHSVRRGLTVSHNLGGLAKRLRVTGISYGLASKRIDPVVATAAVHVELLYTARPL